MRVRLKRFHLSGHTTTKFHPQTENVELHTRQIASTFESTAEEVSLKLSHPRIPSTDS